VAAAVGGGVLVASRGFGGNAESQVLVVANQKGGWATMIGR